MEINKLIKKTGLFSILESLVFIILGAILIWKSDTAMNIISAVIGIILILMGIIKVISFFIAKNEAFVNNDDNLIIGLMSVILGIITIHYSSAIEILFRMIIGLYIVYNALVKLYFSLKMRYIQINVWSFGFILAIVMLIFGIIVIFTPSIIFSILGILMIVYSVIDIIEDLICMKFMNDMMN